MASIPDGRLARAHESLKARRYAVAFQEFTALIDEGHPEAGLGLGWLYGRGLGVEKNYERAEHFLRFAADAGNDDAMFHLGRLHRSHGFHEKAFDAFFEAARRNHLPSIYWTGRAYLKSDGTERDLAKAESLLRSAADHGHVFAARELSLAQYRGTFGRRERVAGLIGLIRAVARGLRIYLADPYGTRTR